MHYPPDVMLLKRIAAELVELRCMMYNIHRDPKKAPVMLPFHLAPDLFPSADYTDKEQETVDEFGSNLIQGVQFGR